MLVFTQNSTHRKATDFNTKALDYLHGNTAVAKAGIAFFHFNDEVDECWVPPFPTRVCIGFIGIELVIFAFYQHFMEIKEGGRF